MKHVSTLLDIFVPVSVMAEVVGIFLSHRQPTYEPLFVSS